MFRRNSRPGYNYSYIKNRVATSARMDFVPRHQPETNRAPPPRAKPTPFPSKTNWSSPDYVPPAPYYPKGASDQEQLRGEPKGRCSSPSCCYYRHAHCNCEQRSDNSVTTDMDKPLERRCCCSSLESLHSVPDLDDLETSGREYKEENLRGQMREYDINSMNSPEVAADRTTPTIKINNSGRSYLDKSPRTKGEQDENCSYESNIESTSDEELSEAQESNDDSCSNSSRSEEYFMEDEQSFYSDRSFCESQYESVTENESDTETDSSSNNFLEIRMAHQTQNRRRVGENVRKDRKQRSKNEMQLKQKDTSANTNQQKQWKNSRSNSNSDAKDFSIKSQIYQKKNIGHNAISRGVQQQAINSQQNDRNTDMQFHNSDACHQVGLESNKFKNNGCESLITKRDAALPRTQTPNQHFPCHSTTATKQGEINNLSKASSSQSNLNDVGPHRKANACPGQYNRFSPVPMRSNATTGLMNIRCLPNKDVSSTTEKQTGAQELNHFSTKNQRALDQNLGNPPFSPARGGEGFEHFSSDQGFHSPQCQYQCSNPGPHFSPADSVVISATGSPGCHIHEEYPHSLQTGYPYNYVNNFNSNIHGHVFQAQSKNVLHPQDTTYRQGFSCKQQQDPYQQHPNPTCDYGATDNEYPKFGPVVGYVSEISSASGMSVTPGMPPATARPGLLGAPGMPIAHGILDPPGMPISRGMQGAPGMQDVTRMQSVPRMQGGPGIQDASRVPVAQGMQGIPGMPGVQRAQGALGISASPGNPAVSGIRTDSTLKHPSGFQPVSGMPVAAGVPPVPETSFMLGMQLAPGMPVTQGMTAASRIPTLTGLSVTPTPVAPGAAGIGMSHAQGLQCAPGMSAAIGVPAAPKMPTAPGMPSVQGMTAVSGMPDASGISVVQRMPAAPGMPSVPGMSTASGMPVVQGISAALGTPIAPGMPVAPGMPSVPGMPTVSGMPSVPGMPTVSGMPSVPGMPAAPGMPTVSGMPSVPGMPTVSGMPSVPGMPTVSGMPSVPGMPAAPGMPTAQRMFNPSVPPVAPVVVNGISPASVMQTSCQPNLADSFNSNGLIQGPQCSHGLGEIVENGPMEQFYPSAVSTYSVQQLPQQMASSLNDHPSSDTCWQEKQSQIVGSTFYNGTWYPPQGAIDFYRQHRTESWKRLVEQNVDSVEEEDSKFKDADQLDDDVRKKNATKQRKKQKKGKAKQQKKKECETQTQLENEKEKERKEENEKEKDETIESEPKDEDKSVTAVFCVAALRHGISIKTAKQKEIEEEAKDPTRALVLAREFAKLKLPNFKQFMTETDAVKNEKEIRWHCYLANTEIKKGKVEAERFVMDGDQMKNCMNRLVNWGSSFEAFPDPRSLPLEARQNTIRTYEEN